jgi:hypothetical protein
LVSQGLLPGFNGCHPSKRETPGRIPYRKAQVSERPQPPEPPLLRRLYPAPEVLDGFEPAKWERHQRDRQDEPHQSGNALRSGNSEGSRRWWRWRTGERAHEHSPLSAEIMLLAYHATSHQSTANTSATGLLKSRKAALPCPCGERRPSRASDSPGTRGVRLSQRRHWRVCRRRALWCVAPLQRYVEELSYRAGTASALPLPGFCGR